MHVGLLSSIASDQSSSCGAQCSSFHVESFQLPVAYLRHAMPVLTDVLPVFEERVLELLLQGHALVAGL